MVFASSGNRYEGQWKDNRQIGKGTMWFANGNKYEGQWKQDRQEGQGTMWFANGERYEGQWKQNRKEGQGSMWFANGERYEGDWRLGQRHGVGVQFAAIVSTENQVSYKEIFNGQWLNDQPLRTQEKETIVKPVWDACKDSAGSSCDNSGNNDDSKLQLPFLEETYHSSAYNSKPNEMNIIASEQRQPTKKRTSYVTTRTTIDDKTSFPEITTSLPFPVQSAPPTKSLLTSPESVSVSARSAIESIKKKNLKDNRK